MRIKTFLKILFFSLLLFLVVMPLRGPYLRGWGGFPMSGLVGFIVYLCYTMFVVNRWEKSLDAWLIVVAILTGRWLLESPFRVIAFNEMIISFPESLVQTLGIFCGFAYWKLKQRTLAYAVLIFCSAIAIFMYYPGYEYWLHKLNFGTFTGNVSYPQPEKIEASTKDASLVTDNELRGKYVVLDFWHSQCGVCFEKFPILQAIYDRYRNNPSVRVFAINKPLEGDKLGDAYQMIESKGYTFPVMVPTDEYLPEKFGVETYPHTFIIDPQGTVVFKGDIAFARGKLDSLVKQ